MLYASIVDAYSENDFDVADAWRRGVRAAFHQTSKGFIQKTKIGEDTWRDATPAEVADRIALYKSRKAAAKRLGMLWGAYHFLSGEGVTDQLNLLLSIEDGSDPMVSFAIDWEPDPSQREMSCGQLRQFVAAFAKRLGRYPIIYAAAFVTEPVHSGGALERGDRLLAQCPLWYCYVNKPTLPKLPTATWPHYTLLQYDTEKRSNGAPPVSFMRPGEDPTTVLEGLDWSSYAPGLAALQHAWPLNPSVVGDVYAII